MWCRVVGYVGACGCEGDGGAQGTVSGVFGSASSSGCALGEGLPPSCCVSRSVIGSPQFSASHSSNAFAACAARRASSWTRKGMSCVRMFLALIMCVGPPPVSSLPPWLSCAPAARPITSAGWAWCCWGLPLCLSSSAAASAAAAAAVVAAGCCCCGWCCVGGGSGGGCGGWDHSGASITTSCASAACCVSVRVSRSSCWMWCWDCLLLFSSLDAPSLAWFICPRRCVICSRLASAAASPPPHVCQSFTRRTWFMRLVPLIMSSLMTASVWVIWLVGIFVCVPKRLFRSFAASSHSIALFWGHWPCWAWLAPCSSALVLVGLRVGAVRGLAPLGAGSCLRSARHRPWQSAVVALPLLGW